MINLCKKNLEQGYPIRLHPVAFLRLKQIFFLLLRTPKKTTSFDRFKLVFFQFLPEYKSAIFIALGLSRCGLKYQDDLSTGICCIVFKPWQEEKRQESWSKQDLTVCHQTHASYYFHKEYASLSNKPEVYYEYIFWFFPGFLPKSS